MMQSRDAKAILLVMALLTNFAQEFMAVSCSENVDAQRDSASKRRIWERLIRLGLTNDESGAESKHFRYQVPLEYAIPARKDLPFLKWYQTNYIADDDSSLIGGEAFNYSSMETNNWSPPFVTDNVDAIYPYEEEPDGDLIAFSSEAETFHFKRHVPQQEYVKRKGRREEKRKGGENKNKLKRLRRKENKRIFELIENEGAVLHNYEGEEYFDCCPSKLIVVEKQVGKDRNNHAVEVRPSQQYFYERICLPSVEDTECMFPARSLRKGMTTRCAQQFSYVQAQVRPYRSDQDWHLDYIHVRSGCSCQVSASRSRKKNKGII